MNIERALKDQFAKLLLNCRLIVIASHRDLRQCHWICFDAISFGIRSFAIPMCDSFKRKLYHSVLPPPQYFYTDRSKAVLQLWFFTVTCSCCPYLYFGSAIMLVTYFVNFR